MFDLVGRGSKAGGKARFVTRSSNGYEGDYDCRRSILIRRAQVRPISLRQKSNTQVEALSCTCCTYIVCRLTKAIMNEDYKKSFTIQRELVFAAERSFQTNYMGECM